MPVEMPEEPAGCAPGNINARAAAAHVAAADVTTRTKSMATISFLIVDVKDDTTGAHFTAVFSPLSVPEVGELYYLFLYYYSFVGCDSIELLN